MIGWIRDTFKRWNRDEQGNRRVWWHWSNENELGYDVTGPPVHGRAWLHVGDATFSIEWTPWTSPGVKVGITDEPHLGGHVSIGPGLFFWMEHRAIYKLLRYTGGSRELSLRIHDGALWWTVWRDAMGSWSRDVPRWREGNFNPADALFGRHAAQRRVVDHQQVMIPMPEGDYPADVIIEAVTWRRPRLPWLAKRMLSADVRLTEHAVPHAGKGTESYNCGDDATYRMSMPATSVNDAVVQFVARSLKTRIRYGGRRDLRWTRAIPTVQQDSGDLPTPTTAG